ncbi:MAG: hypothetical protein ACLTS6_13155 [Anaerobutyricum sp.]
MYSRQELYEQLVFVDARCFQHAPCDGTVLAREKGIQLLVR